MIVQAEIDALVEAFVEDLAGLVRRTAIEAVNQAILADVPAPFAHGATRGRVAPVKAAPVKAAPVKVAPAKAPPIKPAKALAPAPKAKPVAKAAPAKAEPAPEAPKVVIGSVRQRLEQRRGRVVVLPSTQTLEAQAAAAASVASAAPAAPPPVAPPPVAAKPKAPSTPPPPAAEAAPPAEPQPAKKWVVVRRPARTGAADGKPNGVESGEEPVPPSNTVPTTN
jgi:hypothetical protein